MKIKTYFIFTLSINLLICVRWLSNGGCALLLPPHRLHVPRAAKPNARALRRGQHPAPDELVHAARRPGDEAPPRPGVLCQEVRAHRHWSEASHRAVRAPELAARVWAEWEAPLCREDQELDPCVRSEVHIHSHARGQGTDMVGYSLYSILFVKDKIICFDLIDFGYARVHENIFTTNGLTFVFFFKCMSLPVCL